MNYWVKVGFAGSIIIPCLFGLIRFRRINSAWYPFLILLWIGLINEILNIYFALTRQSNALNGNVYVLVESSLLTWQFYNWNVFGGRKGLFWSILGSLAIVWCIECFFLREIGIHAMYFRIFYSFLIVVMSINSFNHQLMNTIGNILKNPVFIISTGFLIYYTYKAIVASFTVLGFSVDFMTNIFIIMVYINCVTNLVYAYGVLCMDKKHPSWLR